MNCTRIPHFKTTNNTIFFQFRVGFSHGGPKGKIQKTYSRTNEE